MKKLLKIIALWFVKISGINLVEPYTLNHLKNMIHNLTDDYNVFKYTPFLIEINAQKALDKKTNIEIYIPLLIDCENIEDAIKIGRNFSDWLADDKKYGSQFTPKHVFTGYKSNAKDPLNKVKKSENIDFKKRVEDAIQKVKGSQYYLTVDLLENRKSIKHSKTPLFTHANAQSFENLVILIEDKEIIDILDNQKE